MSLYEDPMVIPDSNMPAPPPSPWGVVSGKASTTGGYKADTAKLRMELIDPYAMEGLADVLTFGAAKYGDRNWEKGIEWTRIFGSIERHLNAIKKGEDYDPESGKLHADHLLTNAMFLSRFYRTHRYMDDRPAEANPQNPLKASSVSGVGESLGGSKLHKAATKLWKQKHLSGIDSSSLGTWEEPTAGLAENATTSLPPAPFVTAESDCSAHPDSFGGSDF